MQKRVLLLITVLLFILPGAGWAEFSEMNDLELKYIHGTEGIGLEESEAKSESDQLEQEKEALITALLQMFSEQMENDRFKTLLAEFIRGMKDGTIELTDIKYVKEGVSFDINYNHFESDKLANTDAIGFSKQYLNCRTTIDGRINHIIHN
jgi:hypothetical protein